MEAMDFPKKLAMLLKRRRLSQKEVGARIGVDQARLSDWVTGKSKRRPDLDVAMRLAQVLDVSVGYLADDAQDEPPAPLSAAQQRAIEYVEALGLDLNETIRRISTPFIEAPPDGKPYRVKLEGSMTGAEWNAKQAAEAEEEKARTEAEKANHRAKG
jgi:transcriptional regulator with XRE-family HTH domain